LVSIQNNEPYQLRESTLPSSGYTKETTTIERIIPNDPSLRVGSDYSIESTNSGHDLSKLLDGCFKSITGKSRSSGVGGLGVDLKDIDNSQRARDLAFSRMQQKTIMSIES
jgi:hypothetical protein